MNITRFTKSILFTLIIVLTGCFSNKAQEKLTDFVDPMIGTGGHGHTFPGATVPYGMVQLSPDNAITGWDWCSGYHYSDNSIMGFSHTHLSGTGCTDLGDILLMPTTGKLFLNAGSKENPDEGYRSRFSHNNEIAKPGYYSVKLDDYNINVELTTTKRVGFHKYTFPKNDSSQIIIDLVHGIQDKTFDAMIEIVDNQTIQGFRSSDGWAREHTVFFYAKFSKPFDSYGLVDNEKINKNITELRSAKAKSFVKFTTDNNETILVKVGISHTNLEEAKNNLIAEIPHWNFDKIKESADTEWENELSKIAIESKSQKEKTILYTALYHTMIQPNTFTDVSGSYMGMDGKVRHTDNCETYTTFSLWDTFRGAHPLYTIIDRKKANDMVNTLILKYEESGLLPVWELVANETGQMIGNHSISVIYDAYSKGIRDYDVEKAFEAMKVTSMQKNHGLKYYDSMGYIPADLENESVSKILEYAYNDWCVAKMAQDLGKEEDYKHFINRAKFYLNVFDQETKLMRPKKNGKWLEPFDPFSVSGHYTEANAWQYSLFVPQDINNLIEITGGDIKFNKKLDELFEASSELSGRHQPDITGTIGQYAHGNEPSHHVAYLYNYSGQPWKTQEKVHEVIKTLYSDEVDGIAGNEDCGQMSAWYILSTAGFYPVCPGDKNFIIGTPNFEKMTFNFDDNKFVIKANNLSDDNYYVQSVTLNGEVYPYSYINYDDIINGGELIFEMGNKPSDWGSDEKYRPVSNIDFPFIQIPYLTSGERVFDDETTVEIKSVDKEASTYFTTDGSDPVKNGKKYNTPIKVDKTTTVKSVCEKDGLFSKIITTRYNKLDGKTIKLNTMYHEYYTGGGKLGLIDGINGEINFRTDAWQGYEGVDVNAVIDLGETKQISSIGVSFLQETRSWIFLPKEVDFYISNDGINYKKIFNKKNSSNRDDIVQGIKDMNCDLDNVSARYIKVVAKNLGKAPEWHLGAGGKTWIFIDEISIN